VGNEKGNKKYVVKGAPPNILELISKGSAGVREAYIKAKYTNTPFVMPHVSKKEQEHTEQVAKHARGATAVNCGVLRILLKCGTNFLSKDINGFSDPYVIMTHGKEKFKSKIKDVTLNPVWNETHMMNIADVNEPVKFACWDYDHIGQDDALGNTSLDIKTLTPGVPELVMLPLDTQGDLTCELEYTELQ